MKNATTQGRGDLRAIAIVLTAIFFAALFTTGCKKSSSTNASATQPSPAGDGRLHIYTWSEYLPKEVTDEFTRRTGIAVTVDTYESNEVLLSKLGSGVVAYDLVMPSDYTIQPLVRQKLILPLDRTRLTNFANLDRRFLDQRFDPGNRFSIPYLWGTTGIGFSRKAFPDGVRSWDVLFDPKYKGRILMLDDMREVFAVALKKLGKSVNDTDPATLARAADLLKQQHALVRNYDSENYDNKLAGGDVVVAHGWNGQMAKVVSAAPQDFGYALPHEGGTIWLDNVCVPSCARNVEPAYRFLDYILEPGVAAKIVNGVNYASANEAARKFIDPKILNDRNIYPTRDMLEHWEFLDDVGGPTMREMTRLWTEIKAQ